MKKLTVLLVMLLLAQTAWAAGEKEAANMLKNIKWLGHDTFVISGDVVIYTDPFKLHGGVKADIILITHEHYDHCSPEDVDKISGPETVIVTTADCAPKLKGATVKTVKPGDRLTVKGVEVEVVRSYNLNKKFHPMSNDWVGYVFKADDVTYYLAGDTDHIPEMKDIKCDVALLPVSGTYVMTAQEAAAAALEIRPKVAVPMHYGSIVGEETDARSFAELLKGKLDVEILPQE